jgi:hypothetical protein
MPDLSDLDLSILALERDRFHVRGRKDQAIRDATGMNPTAYHARLLALLDSPAALAHDPQLVNRLRRLRDARRRARPARVRGWA